MCLCERCKVTELGKDEKWQVDNEGSSPDRLLLSKLTKENLAGNIWPSEQINKKNENNKQIKAPKECHSIKDNKTKQIEFLFTTRRQSSTKKKSTNYKYFSPNVYLPVLAIINRVQVLYAQHRRLSHFSLSSGLISFSRFFIMAFLSSLHCWYIKIAQL